MLRFYPSHFTSLSSLCAIATDPFLFMTGCSCHWFIAPRRNNGAGMCQRTTHRRIWILDWTELHKIDRTTWAWRKNGDHKYPKNNYLDDVWCAKWWSTTGFGGSRFLDNPDLVSEFSLELTSLLMKKSRGSVPSDIFCSILQLLKSNPFPHYYIKNSPKPCFSIGSILEWNPQ